MIPNIIHQVWIGSKDPPDDYLKISLSWKKYHPTWKYIRWNNESIKSFFNYHIIQKLLQSGNVGHTVIASDIVRYESLKRFGGLYADMDMECLKNITPLLQGKNFICGLEGNPSIAGSALLGCVVGHPVVIEMLNYINKALKNKIPTGVFEHLDICGPQILDKFIKKYSITPLPQKFFYPIGWNEYDKYTQLNNDFPEAYTKHWWKGALQTGWTKAYKDKTMVKKIIEKIWKGVKL